MSENPNANTGNMQNIPGDYSLSVSYLYQSTSVYNPATGDFVPIPDLPAAESNELRLVITKPSNQSE
jgi:hypothetical protein